MLQKIKERFAAGLFGVALGKDHGNVVTPGGTNHARRAFADGGQRNVFGPLLHPVRHGSHGSRRRQHHHVHIIEMRQSLRNELLIFRKRDRKGRPAPGFYAVGFEFGRQTIVGGARAHQNNRLMRESHELFFCKAKSNS